MQRGPVIVAQADSGRHGDTDATTIRQVPPCVFITVPLLNFMGFSMDGSQSINNPLKKQRIVEFSAKKEERDAVDLIEDGISLAIRI